MELPLVSVLVPCYNHEKYIEKAIQSVLENHYNNIELIVIDDGSTDKSYEIANEILQKNRDVLKYTSLSKQKNIGIVKTLNKLINMSHGEYIALLASDDMLTTDGIMERVLYLEENLNYDAVIGKALLIDEKDRIISPDASKYLYHADTTLLKSKYLEEELILRWSVIGPCLLLRRSLYEKIGLYDENYDVEDKDFYLKVLYLKSLKYLDITVAKYRIHRYNISRNKKTSMHTKKQNAIIDLSYSNKFQKKILCIYLKSRIIDFLLLKYSLTIPYYVYKLFRYGIVSIYLFVLKIYVICS
jgi:glycosyltransferase involved in cell wall biosynthesis